MLLKDLMAGNQGIPRSRSQQTESENENSVGKQGKKFFWHLIVTLSWMKKRDVLLQN
jgi:hypothetical protein